MLKKSIIFFSFSFFSIYLSGQSLILESKDSIAYVNSIVGEQAKGDITMKNISSSSKDYYLVRSKVGSSGLVDSNYFCWDLCYPTFAGQSQGTVTIAAGAVAYDFSGYAYVRDTNAVGQDTVWYTVINATDASDTLRIYMVYRFSKTFDLPDDYQEKFSVFPNPVGNESLNVMFSTLNISSELLIVDLRGLIVSRVSIAPSSDHIILNPYDYGLKPGIYSLQRNSSLGMWNFGKLIVH